jgi:hypothetical protein
MDRHQFWLPALLRQPKGLWAVLGAFDLTRRQSLFANCRGQTVFAMHEACQQAKALAHVDVPRLRRCISA